MGGLGRCAGVQAAMVAAVVVVVVGGGGGIVVLVVIVVFHIRGRNRTFSNIGRFWYLYVNPSCFEDPNSS